MQGWGKIAGTDQNKTLSGGIAARVAMTARNEKHNESHPDWSGACLQVEGVPLASTLRIQVFDDSYEDGAHASAILLGTATALLDQKKGSVLSLKLRPTASSEGQWRQDHPDHPEHDKDAVPTVSFDYHLLADGLERLVHSDAFSKMVSSRLESARKDGRGLHERRGAELTQRLATLGLKSLGRSDEALGMVCVHGRGGRELAEGLAHRAHGRVLSVEGLLAKRPVPEFQPLSRLGDSGELLSHSNPNPNSLSAGQQTDALAAAARQAALAASAMTTADKIEMLADEMEAAFKRKTAREKKHPSARQRPGPSSGPPFFLLGFPSTSHELTLLERRMGANLLCGFRIHHPGDPIGVGSGLRVLHRTSRLTTMVSAGMRPDCIAAVMESQAARVLRTRYAMSLAPSSISEGQAASKLQTAMRAMARAQRSAAPAPVARKASKRQLGELGAQIESLQTAMAPTLLESSGVKGRGGKGHRSKRPAAMPVDIPEGEGEPEAAAAEPSPTLKHGPMGTAPVEAIPSATPGAAEEPPTETLQPAPPQPAPQPAAESAAESTASKKPKVGKRGSRSRCT